MKSASDGRIDHTIIRNTIVFVLSVFVIVCRLCAMSDRQGVLLVRAVLSISL